MGADLVGYIVVGPNGKIKALARKKAVRALKLRIATGTWPCGCCGEFATDAEFDDGCGCRNCGAELLDRDAAIRDPVGFVRELADMWPPDPSCRDTVVRAMPWSDNHIIVFAGDYSYGDEPPGPGYQALKELSRSGLMTELGLA